VTQAGSPSIGDFLQNKAIAKKGDTVYFATALSPKGTPILMQMPSLLYLPTMCAQYGSSLPMDFQLCWL